MFFEISFSSVPFTRYTINFSFKLFKSTIKIERFLRTLLKNAKWRSAREYDVVLSQFKAFVVEAK